MRWTDHGRRIVKLMLAASSWPQYVSMPREPAAVQASCSVARLRLYNCRAVFSSNQQHLGQRHPSLIHRTRTSAHAPACNRTKARDNHARFKTRTCPPSKIFPGLRPPRQGHPSGVVFSISPMQELTRRKPSAPQADFRLRGEGVRLCDA